MSNREVDRALILNRVREKQIILKRASELLNLSYPQTKRLWGRYKNLGSKGLISRKRGKSSNRAISQEKCENIVSIISKYYRGCAPLFVSEKLRQFHGISYSSEFLRQLMTKHHLWFPKVKRVQIHQRRERKSAEGELIQADASDHNWFEGRAAKCHLHLFVDDATSKIVGGYFSPEETMEGYYHAFLPFLKEKGRPLNLYTDKRGVFISNHGKKKGETQFARAMRELDIKMISAHSPQAKGRIERTFGTLQERLVWEMRINNICSIEEANQYLPKFILDYNSRFSKKALCSVNAYRPLDQTHSLKHILSTKEERTVSKNLEIQYEKQVYRLKAPPVLQEKLKKSKVTIIRTLDGELVIEYQKQQLEYVCYFEQEFEPLRSLGHFSCAI